MKNKTKPDTHPCNICKEVNPLTNEFYRVDSRNKNGFRGDCRKCETSNSLSRNAKNPMKYTLKTVKTRAKKKNLPFDLDEAFLESIRPTHCPLLGVELVYGGGHGKPLPNSASLDKIIPELGYIKGNVRFLSHKANTMKHNATPEELITFARNVLAEHNIRNINE